MDQMVAKLYAEFHSEASANPKEGCLRRMNCLAKAIGRAHPKSQLEFMEILPPDNETLRSRAKTGLEWYSHYVLSCEGIVFDPTFPTPTPGGDYFAKAFHNDPGTLEIRITTEGPRDPHL